tara:strand:- start:186 stop:722 length:537 start_codon:yes stop_codon:yes gene_type:complete
MSLLNPWVILSLVGFFLVSTVGTGALMYMRGKDDMKAVYTEQELGKANKALVAAHKNNAIGKKAGDDHEQQKVVIHEKTREIYRSVTIPPDADPLLPVWFVRLLNRASSRNTADDPYPGQPDSDPSTIRLSEAGRMLSDGWADKYYVCRKQIEDIGKLNPVLPPPPPSTSFFDKLNPF